MLKSKLGLLALLSTCCLVQAAETPQFHAELLPPLGAEFRDEYLNNLGQVAIAGVSRDRYFQNYSAWLYAQGATNYQSVSFNRTHDARYVNDFGVVYGNFFKVEGFWEYPAGFYRNAGQNNTNSIETPWAITRSFLVNNSGFTVWSDGPFSFLHWGMEPRTLVLPVPTTQGGGTEGAINQSGTLVGNRSLEGGAFLWNPEKFIDLEAQATGADWLEVIPTAINEKEYVVGNGKVNGQNNSSAFIWHADTGFQLLPSLGGDTTVASINNQNWIVGTSNGRGCLWVDGQIYELNHLVAPSTNDIRSATQINEYGVIIASTWPTNIAPANTIVYHQARRPAVLQLTNLPAISATDASTNDNFASRTLLTGAASVVVANNQSATSETGEPAHAGTAAEKSLWWTWQAPRNQTIEVNTLGSWIDTCIAVYRGTNLNSLELVASNDNYGTNQVSLLRFTAQSNEVYQIAVDSTGAGGKILLRVLPQFDAPKGAFAEATTISGASGVTTSTSILAATEKGELDLPNTDQATLWFKWEAPVTGKVALVPLARATNRPLALNLYTGNNLTNLTRLPSVASNANGVVVFQVQAGQEYKLRTLEPAAASGELRFELLHGIDLEVGPSALARSHSVKLKGPYTQEYELQQSTNLVTWDTIQEGTIGSGNQASFNLPNPSGSSAIFYRAVVKP